VTSRLRVATRGSRLAQWQAHHVASLLRDADPRLDVELVIVTTTGDTRTDLPLHSIGGQGVFVKEVQQAVLDCDADIAVHSAKDLPSGSPPDGLVLAAVPPRGDARDALVGARLDDLGPGATVATGSVRRQAQLAARRPDLVFTDLRGNIDSRLEKVPDGGALVVAQAALERLGVAERAAEVMGVATMVPQVGQGALAVECRAGDHGTRRRLETIESAVDRGFVDLERAFLAQLGGGCDLPVGAHARLDADGRVELHAFLAGPKGIWQVRRHGELRDRDWAAAVAREGAAAVGLGDC
jgi:hydroxymethylbilane synthase